MKRLFALGFSFLVTHTVFSQSDSLWKKVYEKNYGEYKDVTIFHDKKKRFITSQILDSKGNVLNETHYRDGLKHGTTRGYYLDTTPYWRANYKDGVLHGSFMVWHKNGELRRKELYKNGIRKEGFCYDSTSNEIPFFEFQTLPKFVGGADALQKYLRKAIPKITFLTERLAFASIDLEVGLDSVATPRRFRCDNPQLRELLLQTIMKMPKWIPGTLDGAVMQSSYRMLVTVQSGQIYLSEFYKEPPQPVRTRTSPSQNSYRNYN